MKSYMILGSFVGFLIGAGFSLADGCSWPTALWRASVAALFVALLVRWWCRVWFLGLREAMDQRRQASVSPPATPKPSAKI